MREAHVIAFTAQDNAEHQHVVAVVVRDQDAHAFTGGELRYCFRQRFAHRGSRIVPSGEPRPGKTVSRAAQYSALVTNFHCRAAKCAAGVCGYRESPCVALARPTLSASAWRWRRRPFLA